MISVEVAINEEVLSNGKTYWFDDDSLMERLKLRVILCRDPDLTKDFLERKFTPKYMKGFREQNLFIEQVIDLSKNHFSSIKDQRSEIIDSKRVYTLPYTVSFNVPVERPKNLSVFAHTFMERQSSSQRRSRELQGTTAAEIVIDNGNTKDSGHIYRLPNKKLWAGPIHYHRATNSFMAGLAHTSEPHAKLERIKVPNFVVEDYRLLELAASKKVMLRPARRKIVKKREENKSAHNIKKVTKNAYISEPVYSYDKNNQVKFLFNIDFNKIIRENTQYGAILDTVDNKAKETIFSRCYIKNLRIFRHRVGQGLRPGDVKLLEYDNRTELIAQSSEVHAGKIPKRIINKHRQENFVDSEEVAVGAIKEIRMSINSNTGFRTIGVTDYDMSVTTDGLYRYSVEMEIEDGTVPFIKAQLNSLFQAKTALENYYSKVMRKGNSDPHTGQLSDDMITQQRSEYPIPDAMEIMRSNRASRAAQIRTGIGQSPWLNSVATYLDVLYNLTNIRYSSILKISRLLQQLCDPAAGSVSGLELFMELIQKLEQQIRIIMGPSIRRMDEVDYDEPTAAYKGKISKGSFTIKKLFKEVHDSNIQKDVGYDFLGGRLRKSIGPRLISTRQLRKRADAENQKYFEITYDQQGTAETGTEEENAYQGDFTKGMDLQDKYYSYYTPAAIHFGKNVRLKMSDRQKGLYAPMQYNNMLASILASNPKASAPAKDLLGGSGTGRQKINIKPPVSFAATDKTDAMDISEEAYSMNIAGSVVLGGFGVTVSSVENYEFKVVNKDLTTGLDEDERPFIDPRDILGEDTKFATDKILADFEADSVSELTNIEEQEDLTEITSTFMSPLIKSEGKLFAKNIKPMSVADLNPYLEENFIDNKFGSETQGNTKKANFLRKQPNQIKSIFLGDRSGTRINWFQRERERGIDLIASPDQSGVFYFLFQHINGIEVLVGYEKDRSGQYQISRPKYKLLDQKLYNSIRDKKLTVLCRLAPFRNPIMNMPEFDSHFLLGPRQRRDSSETSESASTTAATTSTTQRTMSQDIFIDRLTEYAPFNETGNKILRSMVRKSVENDYIPSEFIQTAFIQQPLNTTKVGTKFTSESDPRSMSPGQSTISTVLSQRGRVNRQASAQIEHGGHSDEPATSVGGRTDLGLQNVLEPTETYSAPMGGTSGGSRSGGSGGGGGY